MCSSPNTFFTEPPANPQHIFRKKWNFFWLVWWKMRKCPQNVLGCILASKNIILVIPNKKMDVGFTIASILCILCLRLCSYWYAFVPLRGQNNFIFETNLFKPTNVSPSPLRIQKSPYHILSCAEFQQVLQGPRQTQNHCCNRTRPSQTFSSYNQCVLRQHKKKK